MRLEVLGCRPLKPYKRTNSSTGSGTGGDPHCLDSIPGPLGPPRSDGGVFDPGHPGSDLSHDFSDDVGRDMLGGGPFDGGLADDAPFGNNNLDHVGERSNDPISGGVPNDDGFGYGSKNDGPLNGNHPRFGPVRNHEDHPLGVGFKDSDSRKKGFGFGDDNHHDFGSDWGDGGLKNDDDDAGESFEDGKDPSGFFW